jgi:hypothetical protein
MTQSHAWRSGLFTLAASLCIAAVSCDSARKRQSPTTGESTSEVKAVASYRSSDCVPGELIVNWPKGWVAANIQGVVQLKRGLADQESRVDVRYSWLEGADDSDLRRDSGATNRFYDLLGDISTPDVRVVSAWFLLPSGRLGGEVQVHKLDARVAAPMVSLEFADIAREDLELLLKAILVAKALPIARPQQGETQQERCREVTALKASTTVSVTELGTTSGVVEDMLKASSQPEHHVAIPRGRSSSDYPKIRVVPAVYVGPKAPVR